MIGEEGRLLVIGSLNYDIILKQQRLPKRGETYTVDGVTTGAGGKGANQATQCAKLGIDTIMCGAVGRDLYGEYMCEQLNSWGVDTRFIKRVEESTGLGINNVLPDGSLYANIVRGANYCLAAADIDHLEHQIAGSRMVILQLEIPVDVVEYAVRVARKYDCYVLLNAAPAKPVSEAILSQVDCLVVNENEASYYAGKPISNLDDAILYCDGLYQRIRDLLIITLGEGGSLVRSATEKIAIPARKVNAVDTTGAGDSYIGAFAAKIICGSSYSEAAVYASLAASITITEPGSQEAMPMATELEDLYRRESLEPTHYE